MKIIALIGIITVLAVAGFFISSKKLTTEIMLLPTPIPQAKEIIEKTVAFGIFTNGTFRIFTDQKYHNLSKDVYIDSSSPNIIRVKKANITWDDFFKTLPMKISKDCLITGTNQTFCTNTTQKLKFYINGEFDANALDRKINNKDQLLVSYGDEEDREIENQFQEIPIIK